MNNIILFFIFLVVFALLDFFFIGVIMKGYQSQIGHLARSKPDGGIDIYWPAALVTYIILGLAPSIFIFPYATNGTSLQWFAIQGALLGLIIYGVYEFTNWSYIKDWKTSMVIIDTLWGITAYTLAVAAVGWIGKHFSLFSK